MAQRQPDRFARLGAHAQKRFLIDPTDLPFSFLVRPRLSDPRVETFGGHATPDWDSRIAGPLAALLGMIHGTYDADALFFSRDIVIEGDMEAALALRNALDNAEIDLLDEVTRSLGLPDEIVGLGLQPLARLASRVAGIALTRTTEPHR